MLKYARQLASESLVYGLASVVSRLLFVLLVPIYTRVFTPTEYGEIGLVTTAMVALSILGSLALDNAAHRWFWATDDEGDRKATLATWAWCQLAVSVALGAALTLSAGWVAAVLVGRASVAPYLVLAAWTVPLTTGATVTTNWLRMQRRPWATVAFTLGTTAAALALTLLLVGGLHRGVRGVFEAQLAAGAAGAVLSAALLGDWVHPRWFRAARLREMLRYALPLIPAAAAFWVVGMVDRYFVQHYTTTAQVGLYQVGYAVAALVALGTTAFQQAWGPFALSIHKQDDARRFYALALLLYLWTACGVAAAVSLLAPEVLRIFTTPAYYGAATVVPWLSFSYVMLGLTYVAGIGPGLARQTWPLAVGVTAAAVLDVALNLVLTPRWGKEGSAVATLTAQAVVPLYLFAASQRLYPIPYRFGAGMAIVAAAAAVTALGTTWNPPSPWVGVAGKLLLLSLLLALPPLLGMVRPAQLASMLRRGGPGAAAPQPPGS